MSATPTYGLPFPDANNDAIIPSDIEALARAIEDRLRVGAGRATGTVIPFAGAVAPEGFLLCDGATYPVADYPALAAALGATGDTFTTPDMTGRSPIGASATHPLGDTGGHATHTLTVDEIPTHGHTGTTGYMDRNAAHGHTVDGDGAFNVFVVGWQYIVGGAAYALWVDSDNINLQGWRGHHEHSISATDINHTHSFTTNNAGGGQAHENRHPYIAMNYMVKT